MGDEITRASWKYQQLCLGGNDELSGQMYGKRLLQAEEHQSRNLNEDLEVNAALRQLIDRHVDQEISGGPNPLTYQRCHPMSA